ncbi:MAG TPA: PCRF domain-containing protein, partial [Candidatus Acetothermia bacterium]|nr:PCRF domain-containing protein [Candidatus Acetothermia bacterium]
MIPFDPASVEQEIAALEQQMASPGFWEDRGHATELAQQLERKRASLERFHSLAEELEELTLLHQMAVEAEDDAELESIRTRLASLEAGVRACAIERTFSGPHDAADCYLSINAGAGGTDSQDWA